MTLVQLRKQLQNMHDVINRGPRTWIFRETYQREGLQGEAWSSRRGRRCGRWRSHRPRRSEAWTWSRWPRWLQNPEHMNYSSVYQPFLPRGTLGHQYHYLAALLDSKIGLKVNKINNWRDPWSYGTPVCRVTPDENHWIIRWNQIDSKQITF